MTARARFLRVLDVLVPLALFCRVALQLRRADRLWPDTLLDRPAPVTPGLTRGLQFTGLLAGPRALLGVALLASGVSCWRREYRNAALLMLGVPGVVLPTLLVKFLLERPRPPASRPVPRVVRYSFPSLHASTSAAFAVTASAAPRTPGRPGLLALPLAVGTSRVGLRLHYPSDVLAGWLLGVAWASLVVGWLKEPATPDAGSGPRAQSRATSA